MRRISNGTLVLSIVLAIATFLVVVFGSKYAEAQAEKKYGNHPPSVQNGK